MDANEHNGSPEEAADPRLEELDCQIEKEIAALLEMTGGLPDPQEKGQEALIERLRNTSKPD